MLTSIAVCLALGATVQNRPNVVLGGRDFPRIGNPLQFPTTPFPKHIQDLIEKVKATPPSSTYKLSDEGLGTIGMLRPYVAYYTPLLRGLADLPPAPQPSSLSGVANMERRMRRINAKQGQASLEQMMETCLPVQDRRERLYAVTKEIEIVAAKNQQIEGTLGVAAPVRENGIDFTGFNPPNRGPNPIEEALRRKAYFEHEQAFNKFVDLLDTFDFTVGKAVHENVGRSRVRPSVYQKTFGTFNDWLAAFRDRIGKLGSVDAWVELRSLAAGFGRLTAEKHLGDRRDELARIAVIRPYTAQLNEILSLETEMLIAEKAELERTKADLNRRQAEVSAELAQVDADKKRAQAREKAIRTRLDENIVLRTKVAESLATLATAKQLVSEERAKIPGMPFECSEGKTFETCPTPAHQLAHVKKQSQKMAELRDRLSKLVTQETTLREQKRILDEARSVAQTDMTSAREAKLQIAERSLAILERQTALQQGLSAFLAKRRTYEEDLAGVQAGKVATNKAQAMMDRCDRASVLVRT